MYRLGHEIRGRPGFRDRPLLRDGPKCIGWAMRLGAGQGLGTGLH